MQVITSFVTSTKIMTNKHIITMTGVAATVTSGLRTPDVLRMDLQLYKSIVVFHEQIFLNQLLQMCLELNHIQTQKENHFFLLNWSEVENIINTCR